MTKKSIDMHHLCRSVEALHVHFGGMLGFTTPEDACKLAVPSTTLRGRVNRSLCWKTWCEQDSPSLTTPVAEELVKAHYGARQPGNYKNLFQRLSIQRCASLKPSCECQVKGEALFDFVMLVDVYLNDEGILYCSTESSEFGQELRGCRAPDCQDFEQECGAILKGAHKSLRQGRACLKLLQKVAAHQQQYEYMARGPEGIEGTLAQEMRNQNDFSFSWKLMRKRDGKVQILLDRVVPAISERTFFEGPSKFFLGSVNSIRDVEGEEFPLCKALMHLECNDGEQDLLGYMKAGSKVPAGSVLYGFSVHVGLSRSREGFVGKGAIGALLRNVLRRWL
eukprot:TRINITY_DN13917_c0_g1_i1.p1 TRINITY_DN13917_c0_g1~~TRINITY_DN13917_c0_g1_i1.p1  ORF type:complete len:336 (-),score=24.64 TRINITY_DN13917_c0_g1_i1:209-1216(-)